MHQGHISAVHAFYSLVFYTVLFYAVPGYIIGRRLYARGHPQSTLKTCWQVFLRLAFIAFAFTFVMVVFASICDHGVAYWGWSADWSRDGSKRLPYIHFLANGAVLFIPGLVLGGLAAFLGLRGPQGSGSDGD